MYDQKITSAALMQEKELLDILMDSDLYYELPLKERHVLFKYVVNMYLCSNPTKEGNS
jgi:hypothetical protein